MAYMIDGEDSLEDVVAEVERVYAVRLKVLNDGGGGPGGDDIEMDARGKQDRT